MERTEFKQRLADSRKVLIGLGEEWKQKEGKADREQLIHAYEALCELIKDKDYFIVTMATDALIYDTTLGSEGETRWQRIVAPCGNETWRQCSMACTKDIWEPGEIPDEICPHCGAPLTGNTIKAATYIEEGYLPQWNRYTRWLAGTLNQELLILELGVGFANPGVIRFPFEKTAFFNQKSFLYRIHEKFPQITEELHGRAEGIAMNSVAWILGE